MRSSVLVRSQYSSATSEEPLSDAEGADQPGPENHIHRIGPQYPVVSRGLGRGPGRRRTGDCGFRAWKTPQSVFFSVARLAGSDSLSIRPSEGRGSADLPASSWEPDGARSRGVERVCI
jgi:hypothetical protein